MASSMASPAAHKRYGGFAESSSRTLVGLQKNNVQLQREIEKLERQSQTAINNIANHQQAMKMSWRRLEQRRQNESPLPSRAADRESKSPKSLRALLSSNKTLLYVQSTPDIYGTTERSSKSEQNDDSVVEGDVLQSHNSLHLPPEEPALMLPKMAVQVKSSPYLSPFAIRRTQLSRPGSVAFTSQTFSPPKLTLPKSQTSAGILKPSPLATQTERPRSSSLDEVKLPPLSPTESQPALVVSPNTVDKDTLLQVSAMTGLHAHSHTPEDFRSFYSLSGGDRPRSQMVSFSLTSMPAGGEVAEPQSGQNPEHTEGKELTLAEQFEQIKHCRYIRHYKRDGTAQEEC